MFEYVGDDEIMEMVGQMHAVACSATEKMLAGIAELDRREAWKVDAASNMAGWIVMRLGETHAVAHEWVRLSHALAAMPTIRALFDKAHLSFSQTKAAADVVTHAGADEAAVAEDAVGRSAADLERLAREARRVSREESDTRKDDENLRLRWDKTGMLQIHGRVADATGKVIENALRREADKQSDDVDGQRRPWDKRMADALFTLASASIATDADPDRATIVVHLDAHALTLDPDTLELAKLDLGPLVSLATAHRLACDGRCQVVIDDLLGHTVEVAKTVHAVPRWLRRRVLDRDGGCRWPGCGRTALLHAHHIVFWGHGGPTEEANLVAVCWFHHHAVHEGGWQIEGDPSERLTFTNRHGRVITCGPPPLRDDIRDKLGLRWADDPPAHAA